MRGLVRRARTRPRVERIEVYRLDGPTAPVVPNDLSLSSREVGSADDELLNQIAALGFYVNDAIEVRAKLDAGERCFVALNDDQVLGCYWVVTRSYPDWYLSRTLELDDDEYYYLGGIVRPDVRGRGILPWLIDRITSQIRDEVPNARFFALIRSTNASSLRMVAKLGFETRGDLLLVTLPFGARIQWLRGDNGLTPRNRRLRVDVRAR
jgi:GNAT superfamily N-acetyltransferase